MRSDKLCELCLTPKRMEFVCDTSVPTEDSYFVLGSGSACICKVRPPLETGVLNLENFRWQLLIAVLNSGVHYGTLGHPRHRC